jgi:hypothetical protein
MRRAGLVILICLMGADFRGFSSLGIMLIGLCILTCLGNRCPEQPAQSQLPMRMKGAQ